MKKKIGTTLDRTVFRKLKTLAVQEEKSMSDIIEEALLNYFQREGQDRGSRLAAINRLCSRPFNIPRVELDAIMEEV